MQALARAEKMMLFLHGHFAIREEALREKRKIKLNMDSLRNRGLDNLRNLPAAMAKDPKSWCSLTPRKA